jgi:hypothetical protein
MVLNHTDRLLLGEEQECVQHKGKYNQLSRNLRPIKKAQVADLGPS